MTDFELKTSRQQDTQDFATEQTPPEPPKASTAGAPPDKNMKLCLELIKAESEDEVQKIIDKNREMSDSDNWYPLDGRETSFNIVTNQATTGGKAATELMTNMVDAILTKQAYLNKIDPKAKTDDVPKTMYEAVDQLVSNLHGGQLVNANEQWLQEYSTENLIIGIESSWTKPCLTFADNGEGQNPDSFEKTFLSLSEKNKKDIPFVQGKFNMGSSGVLNFCGKKWFKLIISRRYDLNGQWGWTLMRRRPGDGNSVPVPEYFKINKEIPAFNADYLYPLSKKGGSSFNGFFLRSGTIIKLYDYVLGSNFKGVRNVRNAFNENLVETILPFKIYDMRYNSSPKRPEGIDAQYFYGMDYTLLRSKKNKESEDEEFYSTTDEKNKITVDIINDPELGKIHITAIPLDELPVWLKQSGNRIFHSVNGQVQFKETRGFLTRCGYPALKDRVVIIVDASQLFFKTHNDIWKGDREHLLETATGDIYKLLIKEAIEKSDALKELHNKIAEEALKKTTQKGSADLFQKLVDTDPTLANLLDNRDPSITILNTTKTDENEYEGKFSPTFLELEGKFRDKIIEIPVNKGRPISAKTDAVNDYLHRADSTGYIHISEDSIGKYFRTRGHLRNGRLTVYFTPNPNSGLTAGMRFSFMLGLNDPEMPAPKEQPITIVITERNDEPKKPHKEKKDDPKKESKPPSKDLPTHKLLTKDGRHIFGEETEKWSEDFNELDGGTVLDLGDQGSIYKINYDNAYHLKYRIAKNSDAEKDTLSQKYILGMRLLMFGFERALRDKKNAESGSVADFEDSFRTMAAKGAATTILSLIEGLAKVTTAPDDE